MYKKNDKEVEAIAQELGIDKREFKRFAGKDMVSVFKSLTRKNSFNGEKREGDTIQENSIEADIMPFVELHTFLTERKNAQEEAKKEQAFAQDMDMMMQEHPEYMQAMMAQQQQQQGPSPEEQAMMEQQMMQQQGGAPQGMPPMMGTYGGMLEYKNGGLWANIHAKRARIKAGSGEKMRKPGSKGAPTPKALKDSQTYGGKMNPDGSVIHFNNGGYSYSDYLAPQQAMPVQGVAASGYGQGGMMPRQYNVGGTMRQIGEAGYGLLQGAVGSVTGGALDPLFEAGRAGLQDATMKNMTEEQKEELKRKGEVSSSIGNIGGSMLINPAGGLNQVDEVSDILTNTGPSDDPNNSTRKGLDNAAKIVGTAGQVAGMVAGNQSKKVDSNLGAMDAFAAANDAPMGTTTGYSGGVFTGANDMSNYSSYAPGFTAGADGMATAVPTGNAYGGYMKYMNGGVMNTPVNYNYGGKKQYNTGGPLNPNTAGDPAQIAEFERLMQTGNYTVQQAAQLAAKFVPTNPSVDLAATGVNKDNFFQKLKFRNVSGKTVAKDSFIALEALSDYGFNPKDDTVLTSLTRTEELNKKVGGVSDSLHLTGKAMDVSSQGDSKEFLDWTKSEKGKKWMKDFNINKLDETGKTGAPHWHFEFNDVKDTSKIKNYDTYATTFEDNKDANTGMINLDTYSSNPQVTKELQERYDVMGNPMTSTDNPGADYAMQYGASATPEELEEYKKKYGYNTASTPAASSKDPVLYPNDPEHFMNSYENYKKYAKETGLDAPSEADFKEERKNNMDQYMTQAQRDALYTQYPNLAPNTGANTPNYVMALDPQGSAVPNFTPFFNNQQQQQAITPITNNQQGSTISTKESPDYNYESPDLNLGESGNAGTTVKESAMPYALAGASALYNTLSPRLRKTLQGKDYISPYKTESEVDYDLSEERKQFKRDAAGILKSARNVAGGNAGAYLANLGNYQNQLAQRTAQSFAKENMLETQANAAINARNTAGMNRQNQLVSNIDYQQALAKQQAIAAGDTAALEQLATPFAARQQEKAGINLVNAYLGGSNSPFSIKYVPLEEQFKNRKNTARYGGHLTKKTK